MDRILAAPIAPVEFRGALDFKTYNWNRSFKRFYKVSKYAKQKSVIWRACGDAASGALAGGFNALPNCQTAIYCVCDGLPAGREIAEVVVTYYIKFHHRTRALN